MNAIVDQDWCESEDVDNVAPSDAANDARTHFVLLRVDDYEIEHEGKYISSKRILSREVTQFMAIALDQGELTWADVLDIDNLEVDDTPDEPTTV